MIPAWGFPVAAGFGLGYVVRDVPAAIADPAEGPSWLLIALGIYAVTR